MLLNCFSEKERIICSFLCPHQQCRTAYIPEWLRWSSDRQLGCISCNYLYCGWSLYQDCYCCADVLGGRVSVSRRCRGSCCTYPLDRLLCSFQSSPFCVPLQLCEAAIVCGRDSGFHCYCTTMQRKPQPFFIKKGNTLPFFVPQKECALRGAAVPSALPKKYHSSELPPTKFDTQFRAVI